MTAEIIAIGGGEIGRPGYPIETFDIDSFIYQRASILTQKQDPNFLFIPTASRDNEGYIDVAKAYFGSNGRIISEGQIFHRPWKYHFDCLKLYSGNEDLTAQLDWADIIYVGGGHTRNMLNKWRETGLSDALKQIFLFDDKKLLTGLSAGAICWFEYGYSDSDQLKEDDTLCRDESKSFTLLPCLGFLKGRLSPHLIREKDGRESFVSMDTRRHGSEAIGIDDYAALHIHNNRYKIIRSKPGSTVYRFINGLKEEIPDEGLYPLA